MTNAIDVFMATFPVVCGFDEAPLGDGNAISFRIGDSAGTYSEVLLFVGEVEGRTAHLNGRSANIVVDEVGERIRGSITILEDDLAELPVSGSGTFDVTNCL